MPTPLDDLSGSSLLAVFAHPDDESLACGGLLARCAEYGVRISLLCLTHGEHGPGHHDDPGPGHDGQRLRDVRAGELRDAAQVLGIRDLVLLDHEDGMRPWIDHARLEADILGAIRRFRPHVVLTFDEDGLYWHPDHIAVHERTTAAVAELGTAGPALRYVSLPAGRMRAVVDAASNDPEHGDEPPRPIPSAWPMRMRSDRWPPRRHSSWRPGSLRAGSWPRYDATARSSTGVRWLTSVNETPRGSSVRSTTGVQRSARAMTSSLNALAPRSR